MGILFYRVYKKKLNKFEIALNVAKRLKVCSFSIKIDCWGTYDVEWKKKF